MAQIRIEKLSVVRDEVTILDGVDLVVPDAERMVLLGPSGAGKTMLLRAIAGLESVQRGRVVFDDRDVTNLSSGERDLTMIFAQGGLQPHLDVERNIGLPLTLRRHPRDEVRTRVRAEARVFGLQRLLRRRPRTLSGGEHHQVSLAHSLVRRSNGLLVDEPLTALDVDRRTAALRQLITVQEGYGVTMVLATNDPTIALTLAHHLAVLQHGRLVQTGPIEEVRDRPATLLALQLTSPLPVTVLPGRVEQDAGRSVLAAPPLSIPSFSLAVRDLRDRAVQVAFRPEYVSLADGDDARVGVFQAPVRHTEFLGSHTRVVAGRNPSTAIEALVAGPGPAVDQEARFRVDPSRIHVFDAAGDALVHGI